MGGDRPAMEAEGGARTLRHGMAQRHSGSTGQICLPLCVSIVLVVADAMMDVSRNQLPVMVKVIDECVYDN